MSLHQIMTPHASSTRLFRALGIGLICGVVMGSASGCVRPERGYVDAHGFEKAPYAMPSYLFAVP